MKAFSGVRASGKKRGLVLSAVRVRRFIRVEMSPRGDVQRTVLDDRSAATRVAVRAFDLRHVLFRRFELGVAFETPIRVDFLPAPLDEAFYLVCKAHTAILDIIAR